jgi:hypothetical protein
LTVADHFPEYGRYENRFHRPRRRDSAGQPPDDLQPHSARVSPDHSDHWRPIATCDTRIARVGAGRRAAQRRAVLPASTSFLDPGDR